MPPAKQKTIEQRLDSIEQRLESIEIMLATLLNKMNAAPDGNATVNEAIAHGKASGLSMVDIVKQLNERSRTRKLEEVRRK